MMKRFNLKRSYLALLGAGMLSMAMVGCGSDGDDGEDGKDGVVGSPISAVSTVSAKITSASVSDTGILTVNFSLSDANGAAVLALKNTDISAVSFGRMGTEDEVGLTDLEGKPRDIWLSYFNKDKGDGHYTGSSYFKGGDCEDCLTDNNDGTYTLVLNKEIDTLDKYAYVADVTNGIYLGIKASNTAGATLRDNSFFYWQPSSDTAQEKPKAVIANETCQSCHRPGHAGELAFHGGKHTTLESCTFCHADYNTYSKQDKDENGQPVGEPYVFDGSIKGMAHDIHSHEYYNGIYPQSGGNCLTCHQPDENLAMADAWKADLDTATCMNCHNSPYAVPSWHWDSDKGQIAEGKENCVSCHSAEGEGYRGAERGHYTENANANSTQLKVVFNSVNVAADKLSVTANFKVMDGEDLVPLSQIDPRPYKYGGYNSAVVFNGISGDDFNVNYQKVGFDNLTQLEDGSIQAVIAEPTYKVTQALAGDAVVAMSSQLHVCYESKGKRTDCVAADLDSGKQSAPYLVSDTFYFNQDGTAWEGKDNATTPRTQHAEMKACQDCHTTSITHRYSHDMDGCASCHNGTRDKKGQGPSNLAYIVHSQHYLNGFFKKTDCQSCHGTDGFSLNKIAGDAAPVAFGTTDGQRLGASNEQTVVSPQTAACVSCHLPPYALSDAAVGHIKSFGGVIEVNTLTVGEEQVKVLGVAASDYDAEAQAAGPETCSTCHTSDKLLEQHKNWGFGW
ncbi:OmcA/MtrC family decaheme c-type cytochrome [Shewanella corallii]|uniref:OmcA/MtrC family decaheme c-type cytochrome n=1 Tax=Shewanella corallii TaxID=560080 RepID=A0ABT0N434_9GAMM|nr:OmcA/MtrC family decaheme c-type cytochrome [Shewanella corallii]MCL2913199.1 OmcA/MtrC family decaheme c-type cytochrome [Shewanella corallii]